MTNETSDQNGTKDHTKRIVIVYICVCVCTCCACSVFCLSVEHLPFVVICRKDQSLLNLFFSAPLVKKGLRSCFLSCFRLANKFHEPRARSRGLISPRRFHERIRFAARSWLLVHIYDMRAYWSTERTNKRLWNQPLPPLSSSAKMLIATSRAAFFTYLYASRAIMSCHRRCFPRPGVTQSIILEASYNIIVSCDMKQYFANYSDFDRLFY